MAYEVKLQRRVIRYLKKLTDRKLKARFADLIYSTIAQDPETGDAKTGDLTGVYSMEFQDHGVDYCVAYRIEGRTVVVVLLAGTHEEFYRELKRIL